MGEKDIIDEIRSQIQDDSVIVEKRKPPSYISVFLPKDDDIILIYKEIKKLNLTQINCDTLVDTASLVPEGDITGQPLEAPYCDSIDSCTSVTICEIPEKDRHGPVEVVNGRKYLSLCNLFLKPSLPVWVLCDGSDKYGTTLLSSEQKKGWIKRSWAKCEETQKGLPCLNDLILVHADISKLPHNLIRSDVSSTCYIQRIPSSDDSDTLYSSTILELRWKKLCLDPPIDGGTESTLITKCNIGKGSGGLLFIWEQLTLLQSFLECIINQSQSQCHNVNFALPSNEFWQEFHIAKNLKEGENSSFGARLTKIINEPIRGHRMNLESSALAYFVDCITKIERPGLDLTDKLWYLLIECSTYQELSSAFRQLFSEMKQTGGNKLFLRSDNISRLARVLLGEGGANILDPLEYLVEIGIEKLKTEILLIFSKAQIATLNSLNVPKLRRFSEIPPNSWVGTVKSWLLWLSRMYCVLELVCNTQTALGSANDSLLSFTTTVLKNCMSDSSNIEGVNWLTENPVQQIKTAIPTKLVDSHFSQQFSHWVLTLTSESESRKVCSVFYRGIHSPFPHYILSDDSISEDVTTLSVTGPISYQCAQLHIVEDKIIDIS